MTAEHWRVTALCWGGRMRVLLAQLRRLGAAGERERAQRDDDVEVVQPIGVRAPGDHQHARTRAPDRVVTP